MTSAVYETGNCQPDIENGVRVTENLLELKKLGNLNETDILESPPLRLHTSVVIRST